jgi:hypothetical protein
MTENVYCYTTNELIKRYNLDMLINCEHLIELIFELTDRHGYTKNVKDGGGVYSYAEDLAQLLRDRMEARVANQVTADFEKKAEAAAAKAEVEGRKPKVVTEEKTHEALNKVIAAAQKTSVRTIHL